MKKKKKINKKIDEGVVKRADFLISPNNRLTYIYKIKSKSNEEIIEVTCVSLEIKHQGKWKTIIRFDSSHAGKLHRHTRISLLSKADNVDSYRLPVKRTQKQLLNWSIKNIKDNYLFYKKEFIKRNKIVNITDIEIY